VTGEQTMDVGGGDRGGGGGGHDRTGLRSRVLGEGRTTKSVESGTWPPFVRAARPEVVEY
jgi:hypothetical protein